SHVIDPAAAASRIVVTEDDADADYIGRPGIELVASYDPLTPAERAEQRALSAHVAFRTAEGFVQAKQWLAAHPLEERRLTYLDTRGPRIEIFRDSNPVN